MSMHEENHLSFVSLLVVFVALIEEQFVINPEANDYLSSALVEDAVALYHVVIK